MQIGGAQAHEFANGKGLRLEYGKWPETVTNSSEEQPNEQPTLPAYFRTAPTKPERPPGILSPSDLGGAKALPGERGLDEEAAKRRGRQIHRLLEFLPLTDEAKWEDTAISLLSRGDDALESEEATRLLKEARSVLTKPSLSHLFTQHAFAEVAVSAQLDVLGGKAHTWGD